ncbi:hypothetical protein [Flavitalea sp.]|nr:hypothetical protein [Flavitalea sp.]
MEEVNFVLLWKEQYEKIDQSLQINRRLLKDSLHQKAETALQSVVRTKQIGIAIAIIYLILLGLVLSYAIVHYSSAANYFIVSMGAIFIININALYDYIRHLVWAGAIDYSGSITVIQQQLNRLQLSIARHIRVTFLQLPFWSTFYLSDRWFPSEMGWGYIVFQCLLTLSFVTIALYLYKKLRLENLDRQWVRSVLSGAGGKKVRNAIEFYTEIENFKNENKC